MASILAYRGLHVGLVREGGSAVDLFVSLAHGSKSTALQVKGTEEARRIRKRDNVLTEYQWPCGKKVMGLNPDLIYAFVNMKGGVSEPDIFVVRAGYLQSHFQRLMSERPDKDWSRDMHRFHVRPERIEPYKDDWTPLFKDLEIPGFPRFSS